MPSTSVPTSSMGYKIGYSAGHWAYLQLMSFITQMNFVTESPIISAALFHPLFFAFRQLWDFCKGLWEALVPTIILNPIVATFMVKITSLALEFVQGLLNALANIQKESVMQFEMKQRQSFQQQQTQQPYTR